MAASRTNNEVRRWLGFGLYMAALMVLYFQPLRELLRLSRQSELHSHAPLVPLVSLYFLFTERRRIFGAAGHCIAVGIGLSLVGIALFGFSVRRADAFGAGTYLPATMLALWLSMIGGFVLFFGLQTAKAAAFPLAFLAFAIPLPAAWVERVVAFLCAGSGFFTQLAFQALGEPFLRDGSAFHLGRVSIEIAPECSGIRSSLALFITGTLAAHLFLQRWWSRGLLLLAVVPLAMVKNAIRIATLTLLAEYVDMSFLTGKLHRRGGFVFFGITLLLFAGVLLVLRKLEPDKLTATAGKRSSAEI